MADFPLLRRLATLTAALALAGCIGDNDDVLSAPAPAATNTITVTPSLGRISHARVVLRNARTNQELQRQTLGTGGSIQFKIPESVDAIVVEVLGEAGGDYFDEAKGRKDLPADFIMRAAGQVSGDLNLGVTVLTEAAVQYAEKLPDALTKPANIEAALLKIGEAVGIANINQPPTPVNSEADFASLQDNPADRYALKLAGLVKAASEKTASPTPALELVKTLAKDLSDGQLDGKAGNDPVTDPPYSPLPSVFAESWKFGMENVLEHLPEGELKNQFRSAVVDTTDVKEDTGNVVSGDTVFGGGDGKWKGEIYLLDVGIGQLPDFTTLTPIGSLFTDIIDISQRSFTDPFPGVPSNRFEWFGVRYQGPLTIREAGDYSFRTISDDGSKLYVDDILLVNHDGQHEPSSSAIATVSLAKGVHTLRIEYFQGPRTQIALQVFGNKAGNPEQLLRPVL